MNNNSIPFYPKTVEQLTMLQRFAIHEQMQKHKAALDAAAAAKKTVKKTAEPKFVWSDGKKVRNPKYKAKQAAPVDDRHRKFKVNEPVGDRFSLDSYLAKKTFRGPKVQQTADEKSVAESDNVSVTTVSTANPDNAHLGCLDSDAQPLKKTKGKRAKRTRKPQTETVYEYQQ